MAEGYANSSIKVVAIDNDIITVTANTVGTVSGEPLHEHMQPSFVVDYDEPAVTEMTERLVTLHGDRPELNDLLQFTFDAIPEKTYLRDFDFASRVAERGEGDCTEHAVLLTALARATGRSARVVVGLLLIQENSNFAVYGHAWSEIYDDGRWQIADATMPSITMPEAIVRYLPILQLKNEGPGYAFAMADMFGLFPSRVDLVTGSFPDVE
jgi:hypothetical protein